MKRVAALVSLVVATTLWLAAPAEAAAPNTIIKSGPTGTITTTTARFAFKSKPKAGATFKCRLDAGRFKKCSSPIAYKGLAQGAHTFAVVAKADGQKDKSPATRAFAVDTVAPTTHLESDIFLVTDDHTPTFTFSASEPATFSCRLGAAAFAPCVSPYTPTLPDGEYTFQVRARDLAGNLETNPGVAPFEILTPLTKDLATAEAAAAFVVPDTSDIDVAANCGGSLQIDCPGGVAIPPADQLHITATRSVVDVLTAQSRADVTAQLAITTLAPFTITYSGTTCDVSLVSANGANPTWKLTFQEQFVHQPPSSTEWQINVVNVALAQVDDADIVISSTTSACVLVSWSINVFKSTLMDQFASQFQLSLCAARGPDYIGVCPAP